MKAFIDYYFIFYENSLVHWSIICGFYDNIHGIGSMQILIWNFMCKHVSMQMDIHLRYPIENTQQKLQEVRVQNFCLIKKKKRGWGKSLKHTQIDR